MPHAHSGQIATANNADDIAPKLRDDGVSLYVHLPFCVSKCRYCDFNSYAWTGQDLRAYVDCLLLEAEQRVAALQPQTVFVGGGTPSFLPADLLAECLQRLHEITGFRTSSIESTMEANPESLDEARAQAACAAGINRASVGVQSLRSDVLSAYDRVHSGEQALAALHIASSTFAQWNADLIFAFPGQEIDAWHDDLHQVLALRPSHLSCYELSYEPGTALTRLKDAGRWRAEDPDHCEQLYEFTGAWCQDAGYQRYEVSNFAQAGQQCMHNLAAWRNLDYIGIGAGAASWRNGVRRKNLERPDAYQAAVLAGSDPVGESESPTAAGIAFDCMMMGLRLTTEGVSRARVQQQCGLDPVHHYRETLGPLRDRGWLTWDEQRIVTTPKGSLLLDSILSELMPPLAV